MFDSLKQDARKTADPARLGSTASLPGSGLIEWPESFPEYADCQRIAGHRSGRRWKAPPAERNHRQRSADCTYNQELTAMKVDIPAASFKRSRINLKRHRRQPGICCALSAAFWRPAHFTLLSCLPFQTRRSLWRCCFLSPHLRVCLHVPVSGNQANAMNDTPTTSKKAGPYRVRSGSISKRRLCSKVSKAGAWLTTVATINPIPGESGSTVRRRPFTTWSHLSATTILPFGCRFMHLLSNSMPTMKWRPCDVA